MCESTVFLNDDGKIIEIMNGATRIVMHGNSAVLTNIVGEQITMENVALAEANLLSHGIVFVRKSL
ncbi:MAG: CooT family nickel-binding protein [Methanomassiliicoccus sp.]|nr:CooT family nickel-binding protein [Methanomassiliicoccus sp.]